MMLKQVVLAHCEPVVTCFGSLKIRKCLENGPFWDHKGVKNGSKTRFSKSDPGPFKMLKQVFLARSHPVLTQFSPFHHIYAPLCALRTYLRAVWWSHLELGEGRVLGHRKSQNALKMGRFGTNNGSKMGQKRVFRKMILDHL